MSDLDHTHSAHRSELACAHGNECAVREHAQLTCSGGTAQDNANYHDLLLCFPASTFRLSAFEFYSAPPCLTLVLQDAQLVSSPHYFLRAPHTPGSHRFALWLWHQEAIQQLKTAQLHPREERNATEILIPTWERKATTCDTARA